MHAVACLLALCLHASGGSRDLAAAEKAFEEGRYQEVLPLVRHAREGKLSAGELKRDIELEALTHAAFDQAEPAIEAFRYLLGQDPQYLPDPSASPKLLAWFAEARRRGPLGVAPKPQPPPAPVPAPWTPAPAAANPAPASASPGWYSHWWVWAGAAVVAGGAGALAWYELHPIVPQGQLGVGQMQ